MDSTAVDDSDRSSGKAILSEGADYVSNAKTETTSYSQQHSYNTNLYSPPRRYHHFPYYPGGSVSYSISFDSSTYPPHSHQIPNHPPPPPGIPLASTSNYITTIPPPRGYQYIPQWAVAPVELISDIQPNDGKARSRGQVYDHNFSL